MRWVLKTVKYVIIKIIVSNSFDARSINDVIVSYLLHNEQNYLNNLTLKSTTFFKFELAPIFNYII